ncbi:MAG TPA: hypothetical protein VMU09_12080, partial [Acidimicrobiales bacterium]|nr:hypothetical protein [Acidimicrobiales bacterium]
PAHTDLVSLQWAGSDTAARHLVGSQVDAYRNGVWRDFLLFVTYAGMLLACFLGSKVFWTLPTYRLAWGGFGATVAVVLLSAGQDVLLLVGLGSLHGTWVFRFAAAASFLKFAALVPAGVIAGFAIGTTCIRLTTHPFTAKVWGNACAGDDAEHPFVVPPPPNEWEKPRRENRPRQLDGAINRSWWRAGGRGASPAHSHYLQDQALPGDVARRGTGICVSGGGIRSASVVLGTLQELRQGLPEAFASVDHLVSVSGGGFMAGGARLALQPPPGQDLGGGAVPSDVFAPGSPEEDHLRRHSSYLCDTPGQWIVALGVLLRNLVAALVILGLTAVVVGLGFGRFYLEVPIVGRGLREFPPKWLAPPHAPAPPFPKIPDGVVIGLAMVGAVAVLTYVLLLGARAVVGRRVHRLVVLGGVVTGATLYIAMVGVGIPAIVWFSSWVTWHLGLSARPVLATSTVSVVVSYAGLLVATFWRKKSYVTTAAGDAKKAEKAVSGVLPNGMTQMLIMWVALVLLVAVGFLISGWVATSGLDDSWWSLVAVGVLAAFWLGLDQTAMSLHPYYRRRLASAFAVRRAAPDGLSVAAPYPENEETHLSAYAAPVPGFPVNTFATSANLTGQDRTPPGRRVVSYALGHEYVGGPQVGWIRTECLEMLTDRKASKVVHHDLTVASAMAISGAAFASAMGSQTRFFEVFLAVTNARLGAWLPNPYFVALKAAHRDDWTVPGLPRIRSLTYYFREIFGIHKPTSRLVLCTDGGHYDNLGLVELLRRGCATVICVDASGASQPLADAMSGAISLAREELGIDIVLDDPFDLVAGSGTAIEGLASLSRLNSLLSKAAVITGTIRYPNKDHGRLVFVQTNLTPDLPYELLDFTQADPGFPFDGTADQFFDVGRFDAYQQLGRYLGGKAVAPVEEALGHPVSTHVSVTRAKESPGPGSAAPGQGHEGHQP